MTVRMDDKEKAVAFNPYDAVLRPRLRCDLVPLAKSSERVLVNMNTDVHPELINSHFAYVSVSRHAMRPASLRTTHYIPCIAEGTARGFKSRK